MVRFHQGANSHQKKTRSPIIFIFLAITMQKALLLLFFLTGTLFFGTSVFANCEDTFNSCSLGCTDVSFCPTQCQIDKDNCLSLLQNNEEKKNTAWHTIDNSAKEKEAQKLAACMAANNNDKTYCDCIVNGGIKLNISFPFLGRCISKSGVGANGTSALTAVSSAFTNILMTLILTGGFAMIIWWGVQIAMGDKAWWGMKAGKDKIISVVVAFAALGSLGIILRLINPNFFK